jgi:hypothetical protein
MTITIKTKGDGAKGVWGCPVIQWSVNIDDSQFSPVLSAVLCRTVRPGGGCLGSGFVNSDRRR